MKNRFTFICLLIFLISTNTYSQNPPEIGVVDNYSVFLGSGENHYLIPDVGDGDAGTQDLIISATSRDENIVKVLGVDYQTGDRLAVLKIQEQRTLGNAIIDITITDNDGAVSTELNIEVKAYHYPGALFQIHDAVFWQELIPLNSQAIYEQLILTGEGPYADLNYDEIPLTVNSECNSDPCTGHDFYTSFYKGYIVAPTTGDYTFYMEGENNFGLWLSANTNHNHAVKIIRKGKEEAGTNIGNFQYQSAPVHLEAGNVYAFYATQWIIHATYGGVLMEGPGIPKDFIPGEYMMPLYDTIAPTSPSNLAIQTVTSDMIIISWDPATDNMNIDGYEIYLNGNIYSASLINETFVELKDLDPATKYNVAVKAVDKMGNKSLTSGYLTASTFPNDDINPTPPVSLTTLVSTGISAKLKWSGYSDETSVIGFNVYLSDTLYAFVYGDSVIIRDLIPSNTYVVRIQSVDASYNVSELSESFSFSTSEFDPFGPDLGEKTARMKIEMNNISWNHGIGLNGPYENGQMVNDQSVRDLITDFKAGAIRWGALSANVKSFAGSTGTGKSNTYAKMMDFANELDAYFALTVGVQDGIDFITDPNTFLHLLEYLAGPSTTTYGALRASEGYTDPVLNENSKGVIIEFGNEVWGASAHSAEIGSDYYVYADWCREMSDLIKSSEYYDPEKIILAYSMRNPHPEDSWGLSERTLTGDSGEVECMALSGYLGGNLNYNPELPAWNSEIQYYRQRIDQVRRNIDGFRAHLQMSMKLTGTIKSFYLYESNATTPSYNGRLGQAIVMTDYFAAGMPYGSIVPTIFHLTGGEWKVTLPGDNYKPLPLFTTSKYFNTYCKGHILQTGIETNGKLLNGNGNQTQFDPVGLHAYSNGVNYSLLLISRDFENDYKVQLELPAGFNFTPEATKFVFYNDDFSSTEIFVDSADFNLQNGVIVTVPKFGMVLITFTGDDQNFEKLELGHFDHIQAESIEIQPETESNITVNKERIFFNANILPDEAFFKQVKWEVIEDESNSLFLAYEGTPRMYLKGTGICGDTGTLTVMASSSELPEITATQTVHVSNQGTNCITGVDDKLMEEAWFWPNPANSQISIRTGTTVNSDITVTDLAGKILINKKIYDGEQLDVSYLTTGIYIIKLSGGELTKKSILMKK